MSDVRSEQINKIVLGLKPHRSYLVEHGRRIHATYPANKIDPAIFESITVPVSLPVAMMLLGLGCALLAELPAEPVEEVPT